MQFKIEDDENGGVRFTVDTGSKKRSYHLRDRDDANTLKVLMQAAYNQNPNFEPDDCVPTKPQEPRGKKLVDSLPVVGVFADPIEDTLWIVYPPKDDRARLDGFTKQDLTDAVQKQLLRKVGQIDGQDVYMKTVKANANQKPE